MLTSNQDLVDYFDYLCLVPAWLAALVAGSIAVETITLDAHADPSALLATGFHFRYPSHHEGVVATLAGQS